MNHYPKVDCRICGSVENDGFVVTLGGSYKLAVCDSCASKVNELTVEQLTGNQIATNTISLTKHAEHPTLTKAKVLVEKWQPELHLQQWSVDVEVVPNEGALADAEVYCNTDGRQAVIKIVEDPISLERSIVHELVHLLLDPLHSTFDTVVNELSPSAIAVAKAQRLAADEQTTRLITKILLKGEKHV